MLLRKRKRLEENDKKSGKSRVNIRIARPRNALWRAILRRAILSVSIIRIARPIYFVFFVLIWPPIGSKCCLDYFVLYLWLIYKVYTRCSRVKGIGLWSASNALMVNQMGEWSPLQGNRFQWHFFFVTLYFIKRNNNLADMKYPIGCWVVCLHRNTLQLTLSADF